MKTPTLPLTYYDVLKKSRPPMLFQLISEDLSVSVAQDADPLGSVEGLPHAGTYVDHLLGTITDHMRASMGGGVAEEDILRTIRSAPEFEQFIYQAEIDYLTAFNFERFGRKTFFISRNLVEHLAHTSLNASSDYVRTPFKTCLLVFTDRVALEAFYRIREAPPRVFSDPLNVFLIDRPTGAGLRTLIFLCIHAGEHRTHMLVKRQLLIRDDWDIERMLATDWADLYKLNPDEAVDERRFSEDGLLFFRIVLNVLLYLGSSEADVMEHLSPRGALKELAQQSPKRKKLLRRAEEVSELPFTSVGSRLGVIDVAKPVVSSESADMAMYQLGTRFMVRGHWRQQPFGPGSSQRRLVWIKPYFKGPDMAELINRPYVVR